MARQKTSSVTANGELAPKVKVKERITANPESMVDEKELLRVLT